MSTMSMTGFGQSDVNAGDIQIHIEIKSVNHRFLDTVFRMPPTYSALESDLLKLIRNKLKRGRVDVYINRQDNRTKDYEVRFNKELFNAYLTPIEEVLKDASVDKKATKTLVVSNLIQKKEIMDSVVIENETEEATSLVEQGFKEALASLISMRETEGAALEKELLSLLTSFQKTTTQIEERCESVVSNFRSRLTARLEKLDPEIAIEPERLAQEVALIAEKTDVTEEMARLRSHIEQFKSLLASAEGGRKLEFLLQEMNREVNTTGSKAQSSEMSTLIVEAKSLLEKMREQIQNVE